jgi:hypothetical protein
MHWTLSTILSWMLALSPGVIPLQQVVRIPGPGGGGFKWTIVQKAVHSACGVSNTCTVTGLNPLGAGHVGVLIAPMAGSTTMAFSSGSGGGSYSACPVFPAANACTKVLNLGGSNWAASIVAYNLTTASGGTTAAMTTTGTMVGWDLFFVELAWSGASDSFDTGGSNTIVTPCSSCAGVALTLAGSQEAIIQLCNTGSSCTAISGGTYGNFLNDSDNDAIAIQINSNNGAAPTWTQSPAADLQLAVAIAIKGT